MLCLVLCLHLHNAAHAFFEVAFKYWDLKKNQLIHTITNSEFFVYDWTNSFLIIFFFHMPIRPNSVLFSSNIANSSESFKNSVECSYESTNFFIELLFTLRVGVSSLGMLGMPFGRSVNPISNRLCPSNYNWHPQIFRPSDGPEEYIRINKQT